MSLFTDTNWKFQNHYNNEFHLKILRKKILIMRLRSFLISNQENLARVVISEEIHGRWNVYHDVEGNAMWIEWDQKVYPLNSFYTHIHNDIHLKLILEVEYFLEISAFRKVHWLLNIPYFSPEGLRRKFWNSPILRVQGIFFGK